MKGVMEMLVINIRFQLLTRAEKADEMRQKLNEFEITIMGSEIKAMVMGGYEMSEKIEFQCVARNEKSLRAFLHYLEHEYKPLASVTF